MLGYDCSTFFNVADVFPSHALIIKKDCNSSISISSSNSFPMHFFPFRLVSAYLNKVVTGLIKNMGDSFEEFVDLMLEEAEEANCNYVSCSVNKHWSPMNLR